jgi:hypothetical protein
MEALNEMEAFILPLEPLNEMEEMERILLPNFGSELYLTHNKASLCLSQRLHLLTAKQEMVFPYMERLLSVLSLAYVLLFTLVLYNFIVFLRIKLICLIRRLMLDFHHILLHLESLLSPYPSSFSFYNSCILNSTMSNSKIFPVWSLLNSLGCLFRLNVPL